MSIRIGTSGWHYRHWTGNYYPDTLDSSQWLHHYAREFDCVEVNSTFYRFPSARTVAGWLAAVPEDFRFSLKASRYITHQKKLLDCRKPLNRFVQSARQFGGKLGPLVFQLPPRWHVNLERLTKFLELLPIDLQITMEFRDPSWHCPAVWTLLAERNTAWCEFDFPGIEGAQHVTADFAYLRLHGPGPEAYCGSYSTPYLKKRAQQLADLQKQGIDCWVFFNNDQAANAVINARELKRRCHIDQGEKG